MNKNTHEMLSVIVFLTVTLLAFSSCQSIKSVTIVKMTTSPTSSLENANNFPPNPAQQAITKAISAMSQLNSFSINSDVTAQDIFQENSQSLRSVIRWNGEKSIDIPNNKMQMSTTIDNGDLNGVNSSENYGMFTINTYYDKEYSYEQAWTPGAGNTGGIWSKSILPEEIWSSEYQLSPILNLLKSAGQVIALSSEEVNGEYCQVISFVPSAEAVAGWVLSQEQLPGPSLSVSFESAIVGKDMFIKTYQGGIFQIWIATDSHLIMKAEFNPIFGATSGELIKDRGEQHSSLGDITGETCEFIGQLTFLNYNRRVSIQVPQEALNAQSVSN